MAHAAPSTSEKEKTARLVASLSSKEQAELLAQALLREFMHRRGLHETLRAFDAENPRDDRTISSRALMRQLLNIPVADRPSRLQPTISAASGKPQPPTFMEELCSYRLTKRGYTHPTIRIGDEKASDDEDPSDVETQALYAAVESHRAAKATCEQQQRRYEEMLAEEEDYQRRKKAHKLKKKRQDAKGRRRHSGDGAGARKKRSKGHGDAGGDSDGGRSSNSNSDDEGEGADEDDEEEDEVGGGALFSALGRRLSNSLTRVPTNAQRRRSSSDGSLTGTIGTAWQPPGLTEGSLAGAGAEDGGSAGTPNHHHHTHPSSQPPSTVWSPSRHTTTHNNNNSDSIEEVEGGDALDPFGSTASSQQALMARVRAESRRWAHNPSGDTSDLSTPKKGAEVALAGQPSPLAALSGVPGGLTLESEGALQRPTSSGRSHGGGGMGGRLGGGLGALGGLSGGNARLSATAAGYNPNAVSFGGGFPGADAEASASTSGDAPPVTPYSNGFPPPPSSALAPSIMVKHHSDPSKKETAPSVESGGGRGVRIGGSVSSGGNTADGAATYDRSAVPRSSALAGSSSNNNSSGGVGSRQSPGLMDARSPSPNVALLGDDVSPPSSFHTPSRSAVSASGGSGLRHGIGFRTSVSAEAAPSSSLSAGGGGAEGDAARPSRKERRVKLLID